MCLLGKKKKKEKKKKKKRDKNIINGKSVEYRRLSHNSGLDKVLNITNFFFNAKIVHNVHQLH